MTDSDQYEAHQAKLKRERLVEENNRIREAIEAADKMVFFSSREATRFENLAYRTAAELNVCLMPVALHRTPDPTKDELVFSYSTYPSGVRPVPESQSDHLKAIADRHLMNAVKFGLYARRLRNVLRCRNEPGPPQVMVEVPEVDIEAEEATRAERKTLVGAIEKAVTALNDHIAYRDTLFGLREAVPATPKLPVVGAVRFDQTEDHPVTVHSLASEGHDTMTHLDIVIRAASVNVAGYERYIATMTEKLANL